MGKTLKNAQLERRVLEIAESVRTGQDVEDSRVEIKADWIEPAKAAKRIAGMANAARGENVLWIVGLSETDGVSGADVNELANWWPQVIKRFDAIAPGLVNDLVVQIDGKAVRALEFDTARAPYVVRRVEGQDLEVPWREGTRVRSASRSDLLDILLPLAALPEMEVVGGGASYLAQVKTNTPIPTVVELRANNEDSSDLKEHSIRVNAIVYIVPKSPDSLFVPFHRCRCELHIQEDELKFSSKLNIQPEQVARVVNNKLQRVDLPSSIAFTSSEATITAPGMLYLEAFFRMDAKPPNYFDVVATLSMIGTSNDMQIALSFRGPDSLKGNGDHFRLEKWQVSAITQS